MRQSPTSVAEDVGGCGELRLLPSSSVSLEYPPDHGEGDRNFVSGEVGPKMDIRKHSSSVDTKQAGGTSLLGASFPFSNFSSFGSSPPFLY